MNEIQPIDLTSPKAKARIIYGMRIVLGLLILVCFFLFLIFGVFEFTSKPISNYFNEPHWFSSITYVISQLWASTSNLADKFFIGRNLPGIVIGIIILSAIAQQERFNGLFYIIFVVIIEIIVFEAFDIMPSFYFPYVFAATIAFVPVMARTHYQPVYFIIAIIFALIAFNSHY